MSVMPTNFKTISSNIFCMSLHHACIFTLFLTLSLDVIGFGSAVAFWRLLAKGAIAVRLPIDIAAFVALHWPFSTAYVIMLSFWALKIFSSIAWVIIIPMVTFWDDIFGVDTRFRVLFVLYAAGCLIIDIAAFVLLNRYRLYRQQAEPLRCLSASPDYSPSIFAASAPPRSPSFCHVYENKQIYDKQSSQQFKNLPPIYRPISNFLEKE